jgi:NADH:ubiquinone reductase (non-electrogenic)
LAQATAQSRELCSFIFRLSMLVSFAGSPRAQNAATASNAEPLSERSLKSAKRIETNISKVNLSLAALPVVLLLAARRSARLGRKGMPVKRRDCAATAMRAALPVTALAAGLAAIPAMAAAVATAIEVQPQHKSGKRPKVVVLGSGWGATTFLQGLSKEEAQMYDITIVSPRNYFLYTPLLPAACMGSIEERSIVTPVRKVAAGKAKFFEATCDGIDTKRKSVQCSRTSKGLDSEHHFELSYDILVYAIGAVCNDFKTPGVKEHAFFFKEVSDAHRTRQRITDCFETAALPSTTQKEKEKLLSFVVVGGGPTGVEVAADLADFIRADASELYPEVVNLVKIHLINVGDSLLQTYNRDISQASLEVFQKKGVNVISGCRVSEISKDVVKIKRRSDDNELSLPYGCVVWAAGIRDHPLTTRLKESLIEKNLGVCELNVTCLKQPAKGVITDECLHVRGSGGSIFALGDACTVRHDRTWPYAERLFKAGDKDGNGEIDMEELKDLLMAASDEFPQLQEYGEYLRDTIAIQTEDDSRLATFGSVFGQAAEREEKAWKQVYSLISQRVGDRTARKGNEGVEADLAAVDLNKDGRLDFTEFQALLERVDNNLRPFPATAQVAAQQGKYLAKLFAKGSIDGASKSFDELKKESSPFAYFHKGSLAYLGGGEAAFDLPVLGAITGPLAGVAWKAYETTAQLSWKNRALVGLDWFRTSVFGRDTSDI